MSSHDDIRPTLVVAPSVVLKGWEDDVVNKLHRLDREEAN